MSNHSQYDNHKALCDTIQQALEFADHEQASLVGALLQQAMDAARCNKTTIIDDMIDV